MIVKYILIIILGLFSFIFGSMLLIDYFQAPSDYHFGTEVAGFAYYSSKHYLVIASLQTLSGISCIIFSLFKKIGISITFGLFGLAMLLL